MNSKPNFAFCIPINLDEKYKQQKAITPKGPKNSIVFDMLKKKNKIKNKKKKKKKKKREKKKENNVSRAVGRSLEA